MPKHIQPDQEPTPIGCQIFKELAKSATWLHFSAASSAAEVRIIQSF